MKDCVFCKIIEGEIPSEKVGENDLAYAFLDINPASEGHTVVIPKKHEDNIYDLDDDHYQSVMALGKDLANSLQENLSPIKVGYMVYGFDVAHAHLHLIPLQDGSEMYLKQSSATEEELKNTAEKIRIE